jgi:6,7-dimethyl-8-ribityllumazine synthase
MPMKRHFEESADTDLKATGLRFLIVAARYNRDITDSLLESALKTLEEAGAERAVVLRTPGAFEIPMVLGHYLKQSSYHAGIALGCVIRGDTPHFDYVAGECSRGVMDVALAKDIPIAFGVLTCNTHEQAEERARPDETNKGREAALAAIEMAQRFAPR